MSNGGFFDDIELPEFPEISGELIEIPKSHDLPEEYDVYNQETFADAVGPGEDDCDGDCDDWEEYNGQIYKMIEGENKAEPNNNNNNHLGNQLNDQEASYTNMPNQTFNKEDFVKHAKLENLKNIQREQQLLFEQQQQQQQKHQFNLQLQLNHLNQLPQAQGLTNEQKLKLIQQFQFQQRQIIENRTSSHRKKENFSSGGYKNHEFAAFEAQNNMQQQKYQQSQLQAHFESLNQFPQTKNLSNEQKLMLIQQFQAQEQNKQPQQQHNHHAQFDHDGQASIQEQQQILLQKIQLQQLQQKFKQQQNLSNQELQQISLLKKSLADLNGSNGKNETNDNLMAKKLNQTNTAALNYLISHQVKQQSNSSKMHRLNEVKSLPNVKTLEEIESELLNQSYNRVQLTDAVDKSSSNQENTTAIQQQIVKALLLQKQSNQHHQQLSQQQQLRQRDQHHEQNVLMSQGFNTDNSNMQNFPQNNTSFDNLDQNGSEMTNIRPQAYEELLMLFLKAKNSNGNTSNTMNKQQQNIFN
jgi:hypothetical protein